MSVPPILWEDTLASFQGPVSVWGTVRGPACVPGESTKWERGAGARVQGTLGESGGQPRPRQCKGESALCPWEPRVPGMMEMSLRLLHGPLSKAHNLSAETSGFRGESRSFVGDRRKGGEEIAWAPGVMGRVCGY